MGGGYVGLPTAISLSEAGYGVTVLDSDPSKVRALQSGKSFVRDISDESLNDQLLSGRFQATTSEEILTEVDVVLVCVPTPLNKSRDPDVSALLSVANALVPKMHRKMLVCIESTTYPGFTREAFLPALSQSELVVGRDFHLVFSPERIDPGNETFQLKNTPRVLGGITNDCQKVARSLYEQIVDQVLPVSSTDAAEMVKLLENTFRVVNIGLVNEVALMCQRLGIDTWEVIDAASTKPFGYMPFFPGPGVGGHCIPVDPHYLSWKLRSLKYYSRFIELAGEINSRMPNVVASLVGQALNLDKKAINGSRVLIVGVAYKPNISDTRESPALDVIELLTERGALISYLDPHVPELTLNETVINSVGDLFELPLFDCAVIITHHNSINYEQIVSKIPRIVDTRNVTRNIVPEREDRILRL